LTPKLASKEKSDKSTDEIEKPKKQAIKSTKDRFSKN